MKTKKQFDGAKSYNMASLIEHEVHRQHQADKGGKVVPVQRLALEEDGGEEGENHQRDDFLNDLELHQREGTAVFNEADAVGGHLKGILGQGNGPREKDDGVKRPVGNDLHLLQLQVAVPSERHEDVRHDEQEDGVECFHIYQY